MNGEGVERVETGDQPVSVFEFGSVLVRNRGRILLWMVLGGFLAVLPALFQPPTFTSVATFYPEGTQESGRDGIASLAGQFGISLGGGGGPLQSPQFYADLIEARPILLPVVLDSFPLGAEEEPQPFLKVMEIEGESEALRVQNGLEALSLMIGTSIDRETGVVSLSVQTHSPWLSMTIAQALLTELNRFNLNTRQSQAAEERRFTEERLNEARSALRSAEDRLQNFFQSNRQYQNSPQLRFEEDRLQRELIAQQQIVTSLTQAYEEVRIREVRDTPVMTVIEQPALPLRPDPRGRLRRGIMGLFLGAFFGVFVILVRYAIRRRREAGDPGVEDFMAAVRGLRPRFRRLRRMGKTE